MIDKSFWKNKRVLVTGHTGFKGTWLILLLLEMKVKIWGYSLKAEKDSLFNLVYKKIKKRFIHIESNILDIQELKENIKIIQPDVVIHLAAQPLVRKSYELPLLTWETNLMGTLNILEASKYLKKKCAIIIITTDKVYENKELKNGYKENDKLGGFDPYSASKACTEIAVNSWRMSFCNTPQSNLRISTARAGNVIGGGDWSHDRIIPDIVKALNKNKVIGIRNPYSTRPWQHVLEPINGYLKLAQKIYLSKPSEQDLVFNFGPEKSNNKTVKELVEFVCKIWPGYWEILQTSNNFHETKNLHLISEKANNLLNWYPKWKFEKTILKTINWYINFYDGSDAYELCNLDIRSYFNDNFQDHKFPN